MSKLQFYSLTKTGRMRGNAAASFAKLHVLTHPLRGWLGVLVQETAWGKHVYSGPKHGMQCGF